MLNIMFNKAETLYNFNFQDIFPDTNHGDVDTILLQLEDLKKCVESFTEVSKLNRNKWKTYIDVEFCYESNRIGGNLLNLEESFFALAADEVVKGKPLSHHVEIINHREAIKYMDFCLQNRLELNSDVLKNLHYLLMRINGSEEAGHYRRINTSVPGSNNTTPAANEVIPLMQELLEFYRQNKANTHPVILASIMHARLTLIRPFLDGVGRVARLVMNYILEEGGYLLANFSGDIEERLIYYSLLENYNAESGQERFVTYVARNVKETYFRYLNFLGMTYPSEEGNGKYFYHRLSKISDRSLESRKYDRKTGIFSFIEDYLVNSPMAKK